MRWVLPLGWLQHSHFPSPVVRYYAVHQWLHSVALLDGVCSGHDLLLVSQGRDSYR